MRYYMPINVSVIGVGHMGFLHAQKLSKMAGVKLVGIWDTDTERMNKVAAELGTKAFESFDEIVGYSRAVVLASPSSTHGKLGMHIIERARHLLIEKPIAASVEEAEVLTEIATEHKTVLMVGHIENFNPAFLAAKKYIDKPIFIETHRLTSFRERGADVSVVEDLMIHDLEILAQLCGTNVDSIDVSEASVLTDSSDIANVRMKFENETVANITASRLSLTPQRKMRVFQNNAYISIDFANKIVEIAKIAGENPDGKIIQLGNTDIEVLRPKIAQTDQLEEELKFFINAIKKDTRIDNSSAVWALRMSKYITGKSK